MHWRSIGVPLVILGTTAPFACASAPPPPKPVPLSKKPVSIPADAVVGLGQVLRDLAVSWFPPTLYEASPGWGRTTTVRTGVTWKGKGVNGHLATKRSVRNHGHWRRIKLTADPRTLSLDLRDWKSQDAGPVTFTLVLAFDAHADYVQQRWVNGVKLYDQSVRARLKVWLVLQCEAVSRIDVQGGLLPDMVFRLRILHADLRYGQIVCEHIAGLGGTTAKVAGDFLLHSLRRFHPSLERKLLARADAAIVKAGDTKGVRIGLSKLLAR